MQRIIKQAENEEITAPEILQMTNGNSRILRYNELEQFETLDDVFGRQNAVVLLYQTTPHSGHWVVLLRRPNEIELFDSYGFGQIDQELNYASYNHRPFLSILASKSRKPIRVNQIQLQKKRDDINTCGRWAALRVIFGHLRNAEFANIFVRQSLTNPDDIATCLTLLLKK